MPRPTSFSVPGTTATSGGPRGSAVQLRHRPQRTSVPADRVLDYAGGLLSAPTLPLNAWSNVAVTYTFGSGSSPIFYVNGAPVQTTHSQAPSGDVTADTPYIYIGNNTDLTSGVRRQDGPDPSV